MVHLICCTALAFVPGTHKLATTRAPAASPVMVIGQQASSFGPASLLRKLKADLPQFPWLAEGDGAPRNKIDMPDHVKAVLAQPTAPTREAESAERTDRIRSRAQQAAAVDRWPSGNSRGLTRITNFRASIPPQIDRWRKSSDRCPGRAGMRAGRSSSLS